MDLKITPQRLSFRTTLSDEYDSSPRPSVKRNDFTVNEALVIHL
jgi:hypothetical protein